MASPIAPCRVTVVGPTARVDISLPPQSTVAELVPVLARMTAGDRGGTGWTLARLGAEPMAGSSTVASLGIRDGELLYLNPREAQPAPLLFDDVVDAIASVAADDQGIWRPALTRRIGLAAAFVAFAGTAVLVAVAGPPWPIVTAADSVMAFLLLLVAAMVARAFGDARAGAVLAGAGVPASFFAGAALVAPDGA